MHECSFGLQTEIDTTLCASDVNIFDVGALGEVLDIRGTVEDRRNLVIS